jgi:pimeloyl-ACP methyl ester carboxylesterase
MVASGIGAVAALALAGGIVLSISRGGSTPVLFVHGINSSPGVWDPASASSVAGQAAGITGVTAWTFSYAHPAGRAARAGDELHRCRAGGRPGGAKIRFKSLARIHPICINARSLPASHS